MKYIKFISTILLIAFVTVAFRDLSYVINIKDEIASGTSCPRNDRILDSRHQGNDAKDGIAAELKLLAMTGFWIPAAARNDENDAIYLALVSGDISRFNVLYKELKSRLSKDELLKLLRKFCDLKLNDTTKLFLSSKIQMLLFEEMEDEMEEEAVAAAARPNPREQTIELHPPGYEEPGEYELDALENPDEIIIDIDEIDLSDEEFIDIVNDMSYEMKTDQLFLQIERKDISKILILIDSGIDLFEARNKKGLDVLMFTARFGTPDIFYIIRNAMKNGIQNYVDNSNGALAKHNKRVKNTSKFLEYPILVPLYPVIFLLKKLKKRIEEFGNPRINKVIDVINIILQGFIAIFIGIKYKERYNGIDYIFETGEIRFLKCISFIPMLAWKSHKFRDYFYVAQPMFMSVFLAILLTIFFPIMMTTPIPINPYAFIAAGVVLLVGVINSIYKASNFLMMEKNKKYNEEHSHILENTETSKKQALMNKSLDAYASIKDENKRLEYLKHILIFYYENYALFISDVLKSRNIIAISKLQKDLDIDKEFLFFKLSKSLILSLLEENRDMMEELNEEDDLEEKRRLLHELRLKNKGKLEDIQNDLLILLLHTNYNFQSSPEFFTDLIGDLELDLELDLDQDLALHLSDEIKHYFIRSVIFNTTLLEKKYKKRIQNQRSLLLSFTETRTSTDVEIITQTEYDNDIDFADDDENPDDEVLFSTRILNSWLSFLNNIKRLLEFQDPEIGNTAQENLGRLLGQLNNSETIEEYRNILSQISDVIKSFIERGWTNEQLFRQNKELYLLYIMRKHNVTIMRKDRCVMYADGLVFDKGNQRFLEPSILHIPQLEDNVFTLNHHILYARLLYCFQNIENNSKFVLLLLSRIYFFKQRQLIDPNAPEIRNIVQFGNAV